MSQGGLIIKGFSHGKARKIIDVFLLLAPLATGRAG